jgi:hypothetical protein
MQENEKITVDSDLDTWYGVTANGDKVAITEVSLFEFTSLLANVEDPVLAEKGKELFEKAKTEFYIEMHDGTRLGKSIRAMVDNGLVEIAAELTQDAKEMNIKNGFLDPDPWV